ncbi:MAG: hypothetical protein AB2L14_32905 [Candidatus Xenobiia bacterium LiM19]
MMRSIFKKVGLSLILMILMLGGASNVPAQQNQVQLNLALQKEDLPVQLRADDPFEVKEMPSGGSGQLYVLSTEFTRNVNASFSSSREYDNGSTSLKLLNSTGKIPGETSGHLNSGSCRLFYCESDEKALARYQFLSTPSISNEVKYYRDRGHEGAMLREDIYGEKSTSCLVSEKLDGFWPLSITLLTPGKRVKLKSIFKVKQVVGWFEMSWVEGIPRVTPVNAVASSINRDGREERPTVPAVAEFDEPLSTERAGEITIKKWIERLNSELKGPEAVAIEIQSDNKEYESGQRVIFSGAVKKRQNGALVNYGKAAPFTLLCVIDGGAPFEMSRNGSIKSRKDGTFSFVPFAPHRTGTYSISACVIPAQYPELLSTQKGIRVLTTMSFKVKEPPRLMPEELKARKDKIIELYKAKIPPHRSEVIQRFNSTNIVRKEEAFTPFPSDSACSFQDLSASLAGPAGIYLQILMIGAPKLDDMLLGAYNNQYFNDNGFTCFNYGVRTLQLLNSLRFSSDENERALLRGVDYGPVMRGISRESDSLLSILTGYECGEHHASVLYGFHENWNSEDTTVLDPWPTQSPAVYKLGEFRRFYGTEYFERGRWKVVPDPQWDSSYEIRTFPLQDSPVYWNFNWENYEGWGTTDFSIYRSTAREKKPSLYIVGASPVALEITDQKGRHLGLSEKGELTAEIEGTELFIHPKSRYDLSWYVKVPDGEYMLSIRGIADGTAHITTGRGNGTIACYIPSLKRGETAALPLKPGAGSQPMTLPDGQRLQPILYQAAKPFPFILVPVIAALIVIPSVIFFILLRRNGRRKYYQAAATDSEGYPACPNCGAPCQEGDTFCSQCSSSIAENISHSDEKGRTAHGSPFATGMIIGFTVVILLSLAIFILVKQTVLKKTPHEKSSSLPVATVTASPVLSHDKQRGGPSTLPPTASVTRSPDTDTGPAPPQPTVNQTGPAASQPTAGQTGPAAAKAEHPAVQALMQFIAHTNAKEWDNAYAMTSREGLRNASLSDFNNNWRNNCGMNLEKWNVLDNGNQKVRIYILVTSWDTNQATGEVDRYQYGGAMTFVLEERVWKLTDPLMKTVKKIK